MKKIALVIGFLMALTVLIYLGRWGYKSYLFSATVVDEVYIKQRPFKEVYDLKSRKPKKLLIENVHGWIVTDEILYGAWGEDNYFAVNLKNKKVKRFESIFAVNEYLDSQGIGSYDMNKEENMARQ